MQVSGPNPNAVKIADQLAQVISTATQAAVVSASAGNSNRLDAILVAATGVIGGIHVLSALLGWTGDVNQTRIEPEEMPRLVNQTSTLLAAILCHNMSPQAGRIKDGAAPGMTAIEHQVEFGPDIMWNSIQMVERLTGRPVDGFIEPNMLSSLRRVIAGSDEPLNKFLSQHRPTPGNLH